jgi:UDP-N-acetylglucosamine 2-epimerase (non-hydrolysing)
MKIMLVVGARPNFMKAAPLIAAIQKHNRGNTTLSSTEPSAGAGMIRYVLVHTGQHYDEAMSESFFSDLGLPKPDVHLGVGSGSHASQTAEIMKRFEEVVLRAKPDVIVVVGDVNSTLACTLVAAKISFDSNGTRPLIAHVEAGLRSFDRTMPEEINRILTDHVADLLFVTEESGVKNLRHEGIPEEKIHFVGNTMIDSLLAFMDKADSSTILETLGLRGRRRQSGANGGVGWYALLTLHRPSNVDHRDSFLKILEGMKELADSCPIIFPAHPRTRKRIVEFGLEHRLVVKKGSQARNGSNPISTNKGIYLIDPLGYLDFLCLMKHAGLVLTDSGGIQEETTCLGVPCVTLRENTERPVTVQSGTNVIAGVTKLEIRDAIRLQITSKTRNTVPAKWDGKAGLRIVDQLLSALPEKAFSVGRFSEVSWH